MNTSLTKDAQTHFSPARSISDGDRLKAARLIEVRARLALEQRAQKSAAKQQRLEKRRKTSLTA